MNDTDIKIEPSWKKALAEEFGKEYFRKLVGFVKDQYAKQTVYPAPKNIFHAFELTPFNDVKVVILGQDPYFNPGQAIGLSFAVRDGVKLPPSLQNIFKEMQSDLGEPLTQTNGDLSRWAKQGVLLLNASLTVRAGEPNSHQGQGWEQFTDAAIQALAHEREHLVFILWGNYARSKKAFINPQKHLIIESAHPSPLSASRGFFGSKPFSKANAYLEKYGVKPIQWN